MSELITVQQSQFNESLRALQETDPAHPDTWNPNYHRLLENDHWLRDMLTATQQEVEDILGSDPVQLSDQLEALVEYGAQRIYTERGNQVPEYTITSAVSGDDSIDLGDTAGIEAGQHYHINDRGNLQTVRVAEVLSDKRVLLTEPLYSSVATGSTLSRMAPDRYTTPWLPGMERGGVIHAKGDIINTQGFGGGQWQNLVKRADGGYDIPAGVDRLRVNGSVLRVAVISALPISATRRAVNISPADAATGMTVTPVLKGAPYYPLYGVPQAKRRFQIIRAAGSFAEPLYEADETPVGEVPVIEHTTATPISIGKKYMWRYSDQTKEGEWAPWSLPTAFSTADTYVDTPTVTSPVDGETDVPEQPVIELSAFNVVNGEDVHAATSLRIFDAGGAQVWELSRSTSQLTKITVPAGILQPGKRRYTLEPQYHGEVYGDSARGAGSVITTAESFRPNFETEIGAPFGGGFVAGKIVSDYDGQEYGLIVSDGSGDSQQMGVGRLQWRTAKSAVSTTHGVPPMTLADGRANHNAIAAAAGGNLSSFPAVQWIENNCNANGGLNGHDDWYLPARDELEMLYRALKPTAQDNNTGTRYTSGFGGDGAVHGTNNSASPETGGYSLSAPSQTATESFKEGGADAFTASTYYWSSTEYDGSNAWSQTFSSGHQYRYTKTLTYYVRAVRRIAL